VEKITRTITQSLSALASLASLGGVGLGLYVILSDLADRTDEFDGLGVILGGILAGYSVVVLAFSVTTLVLLARGSRGGYGFAIATAIVGGGPLLMFGLGEHVLGLWALPAIGLVVAALVGLAESPRTRTGSTAVG
jgi:hypothetical protein